MERSVEKRKRLNHYLVICLCWLSQDNHWTITGQKVMKLQALKKYVKAYL